MGLYIQISGYCNDRASTGGTGTSGTGTSGTWLVDADADSLGQLLIIMVIDPEGLSTVI